MKQFFTRSLAVAIVALGVTFSACKKDDPAEPLTYDFSRTATVQGKVLVIADETTDEIVWAAYPATVVAEVSNSELVDGAQGGTYRTKATYNAATGEYSVKVPVGEEGSNVRIIVQDFSGKVRINDVDEDNEPIERDIDALWRSRTLSTPTLYHGDVYTNHNITYSSYSEELDDAVGNEVR
jgi:hypothetical protein